MYLAVRPEVGAFGPRSMPFSCNFGRTRSDDWEGTASGRWKSGLHFGIFVGLRIGMFKKASMRGLARSQGGLENAAGVAEEMIVLTIGLLG